jgi:hypothetical protein
MMDRKSIHASEMSGGVFNDTRGANSNSQTRTSTIPSQ